MRIWEMRIWTVCAALAGMTLWAQGAAAAGYCAAFTEQECSADKGCGWRASHAAGDVNPKSGKPFKRASKATCRFSPKDAQAILAKQFGKK